MFFLSMLYFLTIKHYFFIQNGDKSKGPPYFKKKTAFIANIKQCFLNTFNRNLNIQRHQTTNMFLTPKHSLKFCRKTIKMRIHF